MQWFRLYAEIIDDPKTATLSDSGFRLFIECCALAARAEKEGDTGCDEKRLAFMLRRKVTKPLTEIMAGKLVHIGPDETVVVSAWSKRQFKSDNTTQRSREHRGKQQCNGDATLHATPDATELQRCMQQPCDALDTETDTEQIQNRAEQNKSARGARSVVKPQVEEVFGYWKSAMGHPRAQLDAKRDKAIRARLESYSVEDLCRAVDGCKRTPFNMGQNDRAEVYDDIELICRDAKHVDQFLRAAEQNPGLLSVSATGRKNISAGEVWLAQQQAEREEMANGQH